MSKIQTAIPAPASTPSKVRVLGVIPARLDSQRLPRKILREIAGKPLLAWTYEAALACPQLDEIVIAVDSNEAAQLCQQSCWPWRMTSPAHPSGTDRLQAIAGEIDADLYVNIQADEPLLTPAHIAALLEPFRDPAVEVSTLKTACPPDAIADPNTVKVVTAGDGRALYFSRAPIPFDRNRSTNAAPSRARYWKHLGVYAYRREALRRFAALAPGELEQTEKLEQLRLLENGLSLYVVSVDEATVGVDTEADLRRVDTILRGRLTAATLSEKST